MTDEPLIRWEWVVRSSPELLTRAGEHLVMTSIAVSVGFAVSLGLAIRVRRRRRLRGVRHHPSCVYDSRWSCPLAPPTNWLGVPVRAGERLA